MLVHHFKGSGHVRELHNSFPYAGRTSCQNIHENYFILSQPVSHGSVLLYPPSPCHCVLTAFFLLKMSVKGRLIVVARQGLSQALLRVSYLDSVPRVFGDHSFILNFPFYSFHCEITWHMAMLFCLLLGIWLHRPFTLPDTLPIEACISSCYCCQFHVFSELK